jgi:hypothetical protein
LSLLILNKLTLLQMIDVFLQTFHWALIVAEVEIFIVFQF